MDEFPSNSMAPKPKPAEKPEEKVVKPITSGKVVRRKKPLGVRLREMFIGDSDQGVVEYVLGEVMVPALKEMVTDAVSQGIERMIFGENRPNRKRSSGSSGPFGNTGYTNYNRYSSNKREDRPRRTRQSHDFDDVILDSRQEAQEVIDTLIDWIGKYDAVSVKDLYELVGEEFHHTDEKWGWTNLDRASVRRVGNQSYLLVLPKTEPLD